MNILQKASRLIIKRSFDMVISLIERFSDMQFYRESVSELRKLPENTLGNEIAKYLDENKLTLVPKFESHDLKHVLLNYDMTPEGEIRLQAFMVGNGNYSIPSLAILIFGMLLLPELWSTFYKDFKKGRKTLPLSNWTIEKCADEDLVTLRLRLEQPSLDTKPLFDSNKITAIGAYTAIIAGVFGMLFCVKFLFSSNIADLVGAGFPFIGGAILSVGGLLALSNLLRHKKAVA